jgi:hypothetical protein
VDISWCEPQLLGLRLVRLLPGIGDEEIGGPAMCFPAPEGLDAGLPDTREVFFEQRSQQDQVDQIPVAQVGPAVGRLLGDRVNLLSDLVAQREACDALGAVQLEVGEADG